MRKTKISYLNQFTKNLLFVLDNMNISQKEGIDKVNDYVNYLSNKTTISKYRLKKMLTYDVMKLVTVDDIDELSQVLQVEPIAFLK